MAAPLLPVSLAKDVVVDLFESEFFEPARGPWGHVSQPVVSVDGDRLGVVENTGRLPIEGSQRDVHRSGDVIAFVFGWG